MDNRQFRSAKDKASKKDHPLTLNVLNLPSRSLLLPLTSPSSEYRLFHHSRSKISMAVFTISIPRAKLFTNLEIYQWRRTTDFPITKTRYISVKNERSNASQIVEIEVFNEYCPLKLNHIYEMPTAQAIYLIKQSLIGFERLFNRFGGFEITEPMISINEKGYCRVWINENFASNLYKRKDYSQERMVNKIINTIQSHCIESKNSKRLFVALRKCQNFLQALKMIDTFIMAEKVLVPIRFSFFNFPGRELKKEAGFQNVNRERSFDIIKSPLKNYSRKTPFNLVETRKNSIQNFDRRLNKNRSFSPNNSEIKRFKSEDNKMKKIQEMKISSGETAYSSNIKDIKSSNHGNLSWGQENTIKESKLSSNQLGRKKHARWVQDSSFLVDFSQGKKLQKEKQKKQMSQSEAPIFQLVSTRDRKYSANNFFMHGESSFSKLLSPQKKSSYFKTQNSCFMNQIENPSKLAPRLIVQEEQEGKKTEHLEKIIEENGWKNNVKDFLDGPKVLRESLHEEDQSFHRETPKLQKLDTLNKRQVAMSILPQQYPRDFR